MTPEEIKALLKTELDARDTNLQKLISDGIAGLATDLQTLVAETVAVEKPETPSEQPVSEPLTKRLEFLEEALKAKEKSEAAMQLDQAIASATQGYPVMFPKEIPNILKQHLGELKATDRGYVTPEGKTLDEAAKAFFDSPFGKHQLKADYQDGSGVQPTKTKTSAAPESDTANMLLKAFW